MSNQIKCFVCNKIPQKRKIFLQVKTDIYSGVKDAVLCEDCWFRLPADLEESIVESSYKNKYDSGAIEFNTLILAALKNTKRIRKLNNDYVILFNKKECERFYRFEKKSKLRKFLTETPYSFVFKVYLDGREMK